MFPGDRVSAPQDGESSREGCGDGLTPTGKCSMPLNCRRRNGRNVTPVRPSGCEGPWAFLTWVPSS